MSIKCKKKEVKKKQYTPHKIRSRPFRFIRLPLYCLFLFILYWFVFCPLIYITVSTQYKERYKHSWPNIWPYFFWAVALIVFLLLLTFIICLWCHMSDYEISEETKARQNEYKSLLNEVVQHGTLKMDDKLQTYQVTMKEVSSEPSLKEQNFTFVALKEAEAKLDNYQEQSENPPTEVQEIQKQVKIVPIKSENQMKTDDDNRNSQTTTEAKSMVDDIEKLFPRCSVRRKFDAKIRPGTLILNSPKLEEGNRRHSEHGERQKSPLTPRDIFFHDYIRSANKATRDKTHSFLENEKKHSSNNCVNPRKPEVKDFVLKQKSVVEGSSPQFFIADVSNRSSCTTEAFIYVDAAPTERALQICYIDTDDEVFKSE